MNAIRLVMLAIFTSFTFCCSGQAAQQIITTVSGGGLGGDGVPATLAYLPYPGGITVDSLGNLYITCDNKIRKVGSAGIITTIAGSTVGYSGNNGPATAALLNGPIGVVSDKTGNLYVAERSNNVVRKINAAGIITLVSGNSLSAPQGLAVDGAGNVYVSEYAIVHKIDTAGVITTIAGTGYLGYSGDGGQATSALLYDVRGIAVDGAGNIYLADAHNNRIRKIAPSGIITTIAGTGLAGFSGDGGQAVSAQLNYPTGVAIDAAGSLFIADENNNRIRKIDTAGIITTIAGTGAAAFGGDNGPATQAQLRAPYGVAFDKTGNLYISDNGNSKIRKLSFGASLAIVANQNNVCSGTAVTFTATPVNGGATPAYQWKVNGNNAGIDSAGYTYMPVDGDIVSCVITSSAANASPAVGTSNFVEMHVNPIVTPTITISTPATNVCANVFVNLLATASNGGSLPSYEWRINGVAVGGNTNNVLFNFHPTNNDVVTCNFYSSNACATASMVSSNSITFTTMPVVNTSISVTASQNMICGGTMVTYNATPVNGGSSPQYQWSVNGTNAGVDSAVFSYVPNDHDIVRCLLTSSEACASPAAILSTDITMYVTPLATPAVNITTAQSNICSGQVVHYTATPTNGGAYPFYQWLVNGNTVPGAHSVVYDYVPANGDSVVCIMTSNAICLTDTVVTSNPVGVNVTQTITPIVNIIATPSVAIPLGQQIVFTANIVNGGVSPVYQWRKNGMAIQGATQQIYTATAGADIQANDEISLQVQNTDACGADTISNIWKASIATGVSESIGSHHWLQLYPNPTQGQFAISFQAGRQIHDLQISVMSMSGQRLLEQNFTNVGDSFRKLIDLGQQSRGIYFLEIKADGERFIEKVIVQ